MARIKSTSRKIDTVFIATLFVVFAITTFLVILVAAKQYKHTASEMEQNYEARTGMAYLREIIHQHDSANAISISEFDGQSALDFSQEIGDKTYHTYVYYYDGYLKELFAGEDAVVTRDSGNNIIEAEGLSLAYEQKNVIQLIYNDTNGKEHTMYVSLHSSNKEGL